MGARDRLDRGARAAQIEGAEFLNVSKSSYLHLLQSEEKSSVRTNPALFWSYFRAHNWSSAMALWPELPDLATRERAVGSFVQWIETASERDAIPPDLARYRLDQLLAMAPDTNRAEHIGEVRAKLPVRAVIVNPSTQVSIDSPVVPPALPEDVRGDILTVGDPAGVDPPLKERSKGMELEGLASAYWNFGREETFRELGQSAKASAARAYAIDALSALAHSGQKSAQLRESAQSYEPADVFKTIEWLKNCEVRLEQDGKVEEAEVVRKLIFEAPPRNPNLSPNLIDLNAYYNASLFDGRGWHSTQQWNLGSVLKTEAEREYDVDFDIRGIVQLNSGPTDGKDFNQRFEKFGVEWPKRVTIEVGQKAKAIHFLHSTASGVGELGQEMARYVIHYSDRPDESDPLLWGVDVEDFTWSAENPKSRIRGKYNWGLTTKKWDNPYPNQVITDIDFVSSEKSPAPFLVAITLEQTVSFDLLEASFGTLAAAPERRQSWSNLARLFDRLANIKGVQGVSSDASTWRGLAALIWSKLSKEGDPEAAKRLELAVKSLHKDPPLVLADSAWSYWYRAERPIGDWYAKEYDDSGWPRGTAKFGCGSGSATDSATILDHGDRAKPITAYFRHPLMVDNARRLKTPIRFDMVRDDGAVVYLNGKEIKRDNMPKGKVDHQTKAIETFSPPYEDTPMSFQIAPSLLILGENVIAVEIHEARTPTRNSDVGFQLAVRSVPDITALVRPIDPNDPIVLEGKQIPLPTPLRLELIRLRGDQD